MIFWNITFITKTLTMWGIEKLIHRYFLRFVKLKLNQEGKCNVNIVKDMDQKLSGSIVSDLLQIKKKSYGSVTKGKPILVTRHKTTAITNVVIDGRDVTPKPLSHTIFSGGRERQISVYDISQERHGILVEHRASRSASFSAFRTQSTVRFKADLDKFGGEIGSLIVSSSLASVFTDLIYTPDQSLGTEESVSSTTSEGGEEDVMKMETKKTPSHVSLTLNETETFFLIDIPSSTVEKDTDEGILAEEDNKLYEYLTEGKGKNRKVLHASIQTIPVLKKSRATFCPKAKSKTNSTFVSNWEMHDTYSKEKDEAGTSSSESSESDESSDEPLPDDTGSMDSYRMTADERQYGKLVKNPRFLEAACVVERLLANNCYNEQQKIFRGLTIQDEFRENIEYNYKLKHLWTFANENTKGKSVSSMHWNPLNKDILAVGYGKFYFIDKIPGLVLIWNIKNPVQPERTYNFEDSVTAVHFSSSNPMLLAVGTYTGYVVVINIVSREKLIVGENVPTFEPVWDISWQFGRNEKLGQENVVASFDDGRITSYTVLRKLEKSHLMRVTKADGKLKGYDAMRKCTNLTMPTTRYSAALLNRPHRSNRSIYFVGTEEGVVHKCSYNYLNRHLDLFLAHEGAVNEMKFSPFSEFIFATCGDDWHTRIWAEGISEPLLDIYVMMQSVQGLDWSPTHSTILVTLQSSHIYVWDLQRKVYCPQSVTKSPTKSRNTVVQFTESGTALVVGDEAGNVNVFALEDMPFPAYFQEDLLFDSIYKALITNPTLLNKVKLLRKQPSE